MALTGNPLPSTTIQKVERAIKTGLPSAIADILLSIKPIRVAASNKILDEVGDKSKALCNQSKGGSCLKDNDFESMVHFQWSKILKEMDESCPEVLDILLTIMIPDETADISNWPSSKASVCPTPWLFKAGQIVSA